MHISNLFLTNFKKNKDDILYFSRINILGFDNVSYFTNYSIRNATKIQDFSSSNIIIKENKIIFLANNSIDQNLWYSETNDNVIFSSRQDFIIAVKKNIDINEDAIKWFINTGTLGPKLSIDKNILYKSHEDEITFNISTFKTTNQIVNWKHSFKIDNPLKEVNNLFNNTFKNLFICSNSALSLSAGIDSRLAYHYIVKQNSSIPTVTWGIDGDEKIHNTDAYIANNIAKKISETHFYLPIHPINNYESLIKNMIINSDGRSDHFHAHTDNYKNFIEMNELGFLNLIRGDETFGWVECTTELDSKIGVGLQSLSQFKSFNNDIFNNYNINIEEFFRLGKSETISEYRDRLYREFRIPYVISPLATMKERYIKTINPFLNKTVVNFFINLDDTFKNDKKLIRELAYHKITNTKNSTLNNEQKELFRIMLLPENQSYIKNNLQSDYIPQEISSWLFNRYIDITESQKDLNKFATVKEKIKKFTPYRIKKFLRNSMIGYDINPLIIINRVIAINLYLNYCNNIINDENITYH